MARGSEAIPIDHGNAQHEQEFYKQADKKIPGPSHSGQEWSKDQPRHLQENQKTKNCHVGRTGLPSMPEEDIDDFGCYRAQSDEAGIKSKAGELRRSLVRPF